MRSLISKILTGMWLQQWRNAYTLAQYYAQQAADSSGFAGMCPASRATFHEFISQVWDEAKNRQFIGYAINGRRPSFHASIHQVIEEVTRPAKPPEVISGN